MKKVIILAINWPAFLDCYFRYSDQYHLALAVKSKSDNTSREASFVKTVALFFDEAGSLVRENLEKEVLKLHGSLSSNKKNK